MYLAPSRYVYVVDGQRSAESYQDAETAYRQGRMWAGGRFTVEAVDPVIFCTYDTVTEESAADGDAAERGWIVDGEEYPMPDGVVGFDAVEWCALNVRPVWDRGFIDVDDIEEGEDPIIESAVAFLHDVGYLEPNTCGPGIDGSTVDSYYESEGSRDLYSGDYTSRCYHLEGFTPDQLRAIYRRVAR